MPAQPATVPPTRPRLQALDGLRGLTIILIMLGHAGDVLYPRSIVNSIPGLRGFFGGGAVGIFFVVGGYLVTSGLLRELERGTFDALRFYLRRLVRLGVQVVPLAITIYLVWLWDPTDTATEKATRLSALNVVTHTTNLQASADLFSTRGDLGHMWYLAVQQQVYLALPLVLLLTVGRRWAMVSILAELAVAAVVWRFHVLDTSGWIHATISTLTRADAPLLGAILAVLLHYRGRVLPRPDVVLPAALATMVGLIVLLRELSDPWAFLRWWGMAFTLAAAVTVLAIVETGAATRSMRALAWRPLRWLGKASLALFVWHLPVFLAVERHTKDWDWVPRAITALVVVGAIAWVTHEYVEEPTRRWLGRHLRPRVRTQAPEDKPLLSAVASGPRS